MARLELIRGAGARVFARHGFDVATMEMVAKEAELGKATLYYYFETKQQLFTDIVKAAAGWLRRLSEAELTGGGDADTGLEALSRIVVTYFREYPDYAALLLPLHGGDPREMARRIGPDAAVEVMSAHRPLLDILGPLAERLEDGDALPHLFGSLLLGLAGKVRQGGGASLGGEIGLLCNLLRRACVEE